MTVIAFSGANGGPGVTTTALAALLTWPLRDERHVLLAECDPDGGSIAAGYLESRVLGDMGLHHLQISDRRGHLEQDFWNQVINLSEDGGANRLLLPGLIDPAQAAGLHQTWPRLGQFFADRLQYQPPGHDVLLDLGRSGATGSANAVARSADITAVVVRRTLRSAHAAKPRVHALRAMLEMHGSGATRLGLVVIGEGPYSPRDIAEELELPVFAELPFDPKAAQILTHGGEGGRGFGKSQLLQAAAVMSDKLQGLAVQEQQRLHAPALRPRTALDRLKGSHA